MHNRRRRYFIDKAFQTRFIIKFASLVVIATAISGVIVYLLARATVTTSFENSRLVIKSTADFILPSVLLASAIVIISIGFATILVSLFASHRIAGPLYRLDKDLQEVTSGNLQMKFRLRKSDEMKKLAKSLNIMVESLKADVVNIKKLFLDVEEALGTNNIELARSKLKDLKKIAGRFRT